MMQELTRRSGEGWGNCQAFVSDRHLLKKLYESDRFSLSLRVLFDHVGLVWIDAIRTTSTMVVPFRS